MFEPTQGDLLVWDQNNGYNYCGTLIITAAKIKPSRAATNLSIGHLEMELQIKITKWSKQVLQNFVTKICSFPRTPKDSQSKVAYYSLRSENHQKVTPE